MKKGFILALGLLLFPLFLANHSTVQALGKGLESTGDSYVDEIDPDSNFG